MTSAVFARDVRVIRIAMIQYDLKDLRLFVLVARLRSFRLASERMFMTVSAASVRIRKLEESFKTQLLIRHPREVELTEAGERFFKDAQTVLNQTDNLENHMQRFSGRQDNTVRLFTSYSAITGRLKTDIAQFLLRYPEVRIDFTIMRSKEIIEALLEGTADIGVFGFSDKHVEGLHFVPYFTCKFALLFQTKTVRDQNIGRRISIRQLSDFPLVALSKDTTLQMYLEEHAKQEGVRLNIRARFPNLHSGLASLRALNGAMFVPVDSSVTREIDMTTVELDEPWNQQEIQICLPGGQRHIRNETRQLLTFLSYASHAHADS
mgnify:CR=1 FL=1